MMNSMIKENGVTFRELEKIFMHGFARLEGVYKRIPRAV